MQSQILKYQWIQKSKKILDNNKPVQNKKRKKPRLIVISYQ
jgi:hypothetical protein